MATKWINASKTWADVFIQKLANIDFGPIENQE
jgi:hypothetical protein